MESKNKMKINEIRSNNISKRSGPDTSYKFKTFAKSSYCFDEIEPNIKLYHVADKRNPTIHIVDHSLKSGPKAIGNVGLTPFHMGYRTVSAVDRKYRGRNLGFKTYKSIILKLNLMLISDESQSHGGSYLWTKLWHDPKIFVCGLRVINNKKEYFQVEPDEANSRLLTGKYDIYADDYDEDNNYEYHYYSYEEIVDNMYQNDEISRDKAIELMKKYRTTLKKDNKIYQSVGKNTYLIATKEVK